MQVEVSVALNFVISYLYNKLPRRRVDMFGEQLEKGLKQKFKGHWYPDKPAKGSGFRCVRVNGEKVDPVIVAAAFESGLDIDEIKGYLPEELTLWIDPNEVSYRIGEKGQIKILFSDKVEDNTENEETELLAAATRGFNPEAQCFKPIDTLSSSLGSLNLSPGGISPSASTPSSGWPGSNSASPSTSLFNSSTSSTTSNSLPTYVPKEQNSAHLITAAMFAQTKFGSTKLKTNAKRPTRLSPTEFGNYFRQRTSFIQQQGFDNQQRSRSLSPRDPRVEFMIDQQKRQILAQQQQQHQYAQLQSGVYGDCYRNHSNSPHLSPMGNMGKMFPTNSQLGSPVTSPMSSVNSTPDEAKSFMDNLNLNTVSYPNHYPHLLMAN